MNVILDLLAASFIGAIVILVILNLNVYSSNVKFGSDSELKLQQNAKTLAEIISYDLRKIGFGKSGTALIAAEPKKISFYSDIDSNGVVDIITYQIKDSLPIAGASNEKHKVLYRIVNNDTSKGPSLGLVDIKFNYFTNSGNPTTVLDSISYINSELFLESDFRIVDPSGKKKFLSTYWELTIKPRGI